MKKAVGIVTVLLLFVATNSFAFQFEDYEWGMKNEDVFEKLVLKAKSMERPPDSTKIVYSDELLGNPCDVTFEFTPETNQLAAVSVWWADSGKIELELMETLNIKYGEAVKNQGGHLYTWGGSLDVNDMITYDREYGAAILKYHSEKYCKKAEEERKQLDLKEL